jgi:hypothetical protein
LKDTGNGNGNGNGASFQQNSSSSFGDTVFEKDMKGFSVIGGDDGSDF